MGKRSTFHIGEIFEELHYPQARAGRGKLSRCQDPTAQGQLLRRPDRSGQPCGNHSTAGGRGAGLARARRCRARGVDRRRLDQRVGRAVRGATALPPAAPPGHDVEGGPARAVAERVGEEAHRCSQTLEMQKWLGCQGEGRRRTPTGVGRARGADDGMGGGKHRREAARGIRRRQATRGIAGDGILGTHLVCDPTRAT
ncbi:unnamed protein product [Urochloa humidicola]